MTFTYNGHALYIDDGCVYLVALFRLMVVLLKTIKGL